MDLQTIITALAGIAGVGIGAFLTLKRQDQTGMRLDLAALRVTCFELAENKNYLQTSIKKMVSMPIRTQTWPETRGRLAGSLPPGDFAVVATAYAKLTALELAYGNLLPATPLTSGMLEGAQDVLKRVDAAAAILLVRGWPVEAEREALTAHLRDYL